MLRIIGQPQVCLALAFLTCLAGCGTTRRSDTARTATEQMLLSDAVDRAISRIDFGLLSGHDVYLDPTYIGQAVDKDYITSTLRQHMLACGCVIKDKKDDAELVVEVRTGVIGTDRHDLMFGVPSTTVALGALSPVPGTPTMVPEIALSKRTDQMGVAKIGVFAYERESGRPVWQSGSDVVASRARDTWVLGTGPFQRGSIYEGTKFAGEDLSVPLLSNLRRDKRAPVRVARERVFNPNPLASKDNKSFEEKKAKDEGTFRSAEQLATNGKRGDGAESSPSSERSASGNFAERASFQQPANTHAAPASTSAPSNQRSQFDPVWAPTPLEQRSENRETDRRWPS